LASEADEVGVAVAQQAGSQVGVVHAAVGDHRHARHAARDARGRTPTGKSAPAAAWMASTTSTTTRVRLAGEPP
jgi:hypothetical protein